MTTIVLIFLMINNYKQTDFFVEANLFYEIMFDHRPENN